MTELALFGAALDTGNLGVGALGTAVLEGASQLNPPARVTVFDNSWGQGAGVVRAGGTDIAYQTSGARLSRRYHKSESFGTMKLMAPLRGLGNPGVKILASAAAVLDVSGGDSFTDMYGPKRFRMVMMPKEITHRLKKPLILLPQTYGPFREPETVVAARKVIRAAESAWARDEVSYEVLSDILGADFASEKHHLGVDMAFGLTPTEPAGHADLKEWLASPSPVVGVNVSGLLFSAPPKGTTRDEMSIDYRAVMERLVQRFLAETDARVLFVPHVLGKAPGSESDETAVAKLMASANFDPERVRVIPTDGLSANEAKWWISRCAWFTGARMHSTIGALSSGVPTAALAYSMKTGPVFATVGQQDHVIDARQASTDDAIDRLFNSWLSRADARASLAQWLPAVKDQALAQMETIMTAAARS